MLTVTASRTAWLKAVNKRLLPQNDEITFRPIIYKKQSNRAYDAEHPDTRCQTSRGAYAIRTPSRPNFHKDLLSKKVKVTWTSYINVCNHKQENTQKAVESTSSVLLLQKPQRHNPHVGLRSIADLLTTALPNSAYSYLVLALFTVLGF